MKILSASGPHRDSPKRMVAASMMRRLIYPWYNAVLSVLFAYLACRAASAAWHWGVLQAVELPSGADVCLHAEGACWSAVETKWRLVVFGLYPPAAQWRPALWLLGCLLLLVVSAWPACWRRWLLPLWIVAASLGMLLMRGGWAGISTIAPDQWGGLPLTLMLTIGGAAIAFPLGIVLALARTGAIVPVRAVSTAFIELMRGIPLITLLFIASVIMPLYLPEAFPLSKVARATILIGLCASGYVAEALRGALRAVSKGQTEGAYSLGLSYWQTQRYIILPQALRVALPSLINTLLSFFKSTSLVLVIGLFDLLGTTRAAIADPVWQAAFVELYLFAGVIYFVLCAAISAYSRWIEHRGARSVNH